MVAKPAARSHLSSSVAIASSTAVSWASSNRLATRSSPSLAPPDVPARPPLELVADAAERLVAPRASAQRPRGMQEDPADRRVAPTAEHLVVAGDAPGPRMTLAATLGSRAEVAILVDGGRLPVRGPGGGANLGAARRHQGPRRAAGREQSDAVRVRPAGPARRRDEDVGQGAAVRGP